MTTKTITYKDFQCQEAQDANVLVDYFEGNQLKYVVAGLDGKSKWGGKRHDWKSRGFAPRTRNIVNSIIEKSAPLFNKEPTLSIWRDNIDKPVLDPVLADLLTRANWLEFFQNVDAYTRLLKGTCVLLQKYIAEDKSTVGGIYKFDKSQDALMLSLLHRGNCVVKMDRTETYIIELAFLTNDDGDNDADDEEDQSWTYRCITPQEIIDVVVDDDEGENIVARTPNVDGIVPAVMFYDTKTPVRGVWNKIPEDLRSAQDLLNQHLTDLDFAIAYQKMQAIVTTADIIDSGASRDVLIPAAPMGHSDAGELYQDVPAFQLNTKSNIGGLGSIIKLTLDPQGNPPMFDFKGPTTQLKPLSDVVIDFISGIASDWAVDLQVAGHGRAAHSGFQLIVEEMPNLQLREKRSKLFGAGMQRLYQNLRVLYPELTEGNLLIQFAPPSLPVNAMEEDNLWAAKIAGGRANLLDYYVENQGLSKEEALAKINEVIEVHKILVDGGFTPDLPVLAPTTTQPGTDVSLNSSSPVAS